MFFADAVATPEWHEHVEKQEKKAHDLRDKLAAKAAELKVGDQAARKLLRP